MTNLVVQRGEGGGVALLQEHSEGTHGACPAELIAPCGFHLCLHSVQGEEVLQVEGSLVLLRSGIGVQVGRELQAEVASHLLTLLLLILPFKLQLPEVASLALRCSNQLLVRVEGGEGEASWGRLLKEQLLSSKVESGLGKREHQNLVKV